MAAADHDLYVAQTVDYDDGSLARTSARPSPRVLRFKLADGLWVQSNSLAVANPAADRVSVWSIRALAIDESRR